MARPMPVTWCEYCSDLEEGSYLPVTPPVIQADLPASKAAILRDVLLFPGA